MKDKRHETILEIIQGKEIATQEELQIELRERGFEVTQATVSRDIRRLRLVKRQTPSGRNIYAVPAEQKDLEQEKLLRVLRDSVLRVDYAQNILVIKTAAGMAMAAAAAIDGLPIADIVGCIAGDDTIMAAMRTTEAAIEAGQLLKKDLGMES